VHPFLEAIIAPKTLLGSFLALTIGGLLFFPITSGTSWLYYCVLRRSRFFPNDDVQKEREQRKKEWKWAFYNVVGNGILTAPVHHWIVQGQSKVYFDVSERGWPYLIGSVVAILVITGSTSPVRIPVPSPRWSLRRVHHLLAGVVHVHSRASDLGPKPARELHGLPHPPSQGEQAQLRPVLHYLRPTLGHLP
jgi:hypothetical protein